ncbi:MAG: hypothetical protein OEV49_14465 [candidate division Zixibacteria bacterium]|nr:hypothetical protein [candidate division Zixibacteria bacterium]MDH3937781.1 hypothetical protein [candidate division Zixibacteria bacterium]MDH4035256.1 hypothetical protein [candidate division Zixibacteria bacterium]
MMAVQSSLPNVKPHECVLICGVPITQANFDQARERPDKSYAKLYRSVLYRPVWETYDSRFAGIFQSVAKDMRQLGVKVATEVTLPLFRELCEQFQTGVIVLFTHCEGNQLEFHDGMYDIEQVIELIPPEYSSLMDVCACNSLPLAAEIRLSRPTCIVHDSEKKAHPVFWLYVYRAVFGQLKAKSRPYLLVMEEVRRELLKAWRRR